MPIIEQAIDKYQNDLPEEIRLICESDRAIAAMKELEARYGIELSSLIVFFAVGEVALEEVSDYLQNEYNLDEAAAKTAAQDIEDTLLKPLAERVDFINEHPDKTMTLEQEKVVVENIFRKSLIEEFNEDLVLIDAINRRLFAILGRDLSFQKRMEQLLYENDEVVTEQMLMIDGQKQKGTIGNWIKDFIAKHGSQSYDSVSLSAFLINSENGKQLSEEERKKVARVLRLYVNVKFFPESMPSDNPQDWQMIPYEVTPETVPAPIEQPKVQAPTVTEKPGPTNPELLELKNMLLQYPAGSLERAAIEEEIRRFEQS